MLPWLVALTDGDTAFEATIPMRPFEHEREWEGGSIEVASGLVEAFTIGPDRRNLEIVVRCREAEVHALMDMVSWGVRNPGLLSVHPNGLADDGYAVYVLSPKHGEKWRPRRGSEMDTFEATLTVRRVDGQDWSAINYYSPPS
jgi:hypothetical protein